jgi:hypothetical protein
LAAIDLGSRFPTAAAASGIFADIVAREGEMVRPLRSHDYFARVFIEQGALTWPNGYDVDSISLHQEMKEAGLLFNSRP